MFAAPRRLKIRPKRSLTPDLGQNEMPHTKSILISIASLARKMSRICQSAFCCRVVSYTTKPRLLPYSTNTFSSSEPMVLLNFVAKAIQSGASPAIGSVHLHMFIKRGTDVDAWRRALRPVSKELTGMQNVYIMMDQGVEPARHIG